jgi:hypothetical protein
MKNRSENTQEPLKVVNDCQQDLSVGRQVIRKDR